MVSSCWGASSDASLKAGAPPPGCIMQDHCPSCVRPSRNDPSRQRQRHLKQSLLPLPSFSPFFFFLLLLCLRFLGALPPRAAAIPPHAEQGGSPGPGTQRALQRPDVGSRCSRNKKITSTLLCAGGDDPPPSATTRDNVGKFQSSALQCLPDACNARPTL
jgi:hypothetical protein